MVKCRVDPTRSSWGLNDYRISYGTLGMATDGFDQQLADGERHGWPLVCAISIHTFLMGQPHRARQLKQILEHMAAQRSQVWFATPGQIAEHVAGLPEGMVAKP